MSSLTDRVESLKEKLDRLENTVESLNYDEVYEDLQERVRDLEEIAYGLPVKKKGVEIDEEHSYLIKMCNLVDVKKKKIPLKWFQGFDETNTVCWSSSEHDAFRFESENDANNVAESFSIPVGFRICVVNSDE